jgi:hypothetical protein
MGSVGSMGGILKTTTRTMKVENLSETLADDERNASDPMLGFGEGEGSQDREGKIQKMKSMFTDLAGYV